MDDGTPPADAVRPGARGPPPGADDTELLRYTRTSSGHLVGCGDIGGEYVSAIHDGEADVPEGLVTYTFRMDPAVEEEYRRVRRERRNGGADGGVGGPPGGTGPDREKPGLIQRLGRWFGFGRKGKGEEREGDAAPVPAAANVIPHGQTEFEAMVEAISDSIQDVDLVILVCDLEDPEGFESARVFAEVTRERGILSFCYVFLPRGFAKVDEVHRANRDLQRLRLIVDIVAVLPNHEYISPGDLAAIIKETVEVTATAGLVNVDVADLKSTVQGGNVALIGIGEAEGEDRLTEAVKRALSHRLMLIDYAAVNKAVVNVTGGEDMTIEDAEGAARWLAKLIKEEAKIVWGAEVEKDMVGRLRVFVMAAATPVEVLLYIYTQE